MKRPMLFQILGDSVIELMSMTGEKLRLHQYVPYFSVYYTFNYIEVIDDGEM